MVWLQPATHVSDSVQIHHDKNCIKSLFVVCTLSPAGGLSNKISTSANLISVFLTPPHTSENHAFVGHFDFLSVQFPNRQTIRVYRLFVSWINPSIVSSCKTSLLMIVGSRTIPSTMKHCCAKWMAESSLGWESCRHVGNMSA